MEKKKPFALTSPSAPRFPMRNTPNWKSWPKPEGWTLSEWVREVLIAHPAEQIILAEVLALRMLYLNTVQILGAGRELTTEDLRKLIERVDREKQRKATERLAGKDGNSPGTNTAS
jgi:hypothetical protein